MIAETTPMNMIAILSCIFVTVALFYTVRFSFSREYHVHTTSGIVLITGASSGIGRHAAIFLASAGFHVFAGVRKESDLLNFTRSNISHLYPIILDVTSDEACFKSKVVVQEHMKKLKLPFIALINNAGISRSIPIEFHHLDDAKAVFDTNTFGALQLSQQFIQLLRESKGRLIFVGSVAGKVAAPLIGLYAASKFAIEAIGDAFRRELAGK